MNRKQRKLQFIRMKNLIRRFGAYTVLTRIIINRDGELDTFHLNLDKLYTKGYQMLYLEENER